MNRTGHRGRVDANHAEVVAALRKAGATVVSLASIGDGVPDLLVGYRGETVLIELKDDSKPPSERLLTADEIKFQSQWTGATIRNTGSVEGALSILRSI